MVIQVKPKLGPVYTKEMKSKNKLALKKFMNILGKYKDADRKVWSTSELVLKINEKVTEDKKVSPQVLGRLIVCQQQYDAYKRVNSQRDIYEYIFVRKKIGGR